MNTSTINSKLSSELKSFLEFELSQYHTYKQMLKDIEHDAIYGSSPNDGQPRGTDTSDPTCRKAIKLINNIRLKRLADTVHAIETVYNKLEPCRQEFVRRVYWSTEQIDVYAITFDVGITRRSFSRWKADIVFALACEMGLADTF